MSKIKILIDPIIEQNEVFIDKEVKIRETIGVSLVKLRIKFSLKISGEKMPDAIVINSIKISPKSRDSFIFTSEVELKINNFQPDEEIITDSIEYLFPFPDLYWIEAQVKDISGFEIETVQKMPDGRTGRGWPAINGLTNDSTNPGMKRKWINTVIVLDRFAFEQRNLNKTIKKLTVILVIIAIIQIMLSAYPEILVILKFWITSSWNFYF